MSSTPNAAARAPSIYPILAVNFVGTLGFSIVLPFLVFLVTRLGGNALVYGLMGATYSFFQLIGAPILGRWSDRFGRKRVLLLSHLGTLSSWVLFLIALLLPVRTMLEVDSRLLGAFTLTLPLVVLFFARALDGITGGNVSVANAYLADITADEDRSANFGKLAVSSNLGFILGPALAATLGATAMGETLPVLAALLISVVASLIIAFRLEESTCSTLTADPASTNIRRVFGQEHKECFELERPPTAGAGEVLRQPHVPLLLAAYFLVFLAFNFFYIAFPVHAATSLDWTLLDTGVFFSVLGFLMALVQGPVLRQVSKRWADHRLIIGGSAVLATSFLLFTSPATGTIYSGTALLALGNGLMWPSLMAVLSKAADPRMQGAVQGFASSVGAVASILGLVAGGMLYQYVGGKIFVVSAVLTAFVFAFSFLIKKPAEPTGSASARSDAPVDAAIGDDT